MEATSPVCEAKGPLKGIRRALSENYFRASNLASSGRIRVVVADKIQFSVGRPRDCHNHRHQAAHLGSRCGRGAVTGQSQQTSPFGVLVALVTQWGQKAQLIVHVQAFGASIVSSVTCSASVCCLSVQRLRSVDEGARQ